MKHLKWILACLLAAAVSVPVFLACDREDQPRDTEPVTTEATETLAPSDLHTDLTSFRIESGDSVLKIEIQEGVPVFTELSTKKSGDNHLSGSAVCKLPSKFDTPDKTEKFDWQFIGYRVYSDDLGGEGYILEFTAQNIEATYQMYVIGCPEWGGPFEIKGYLTNGTDSKLTIFPNDYFTTTVVGSSAPTVWTFEKEGGMAEGWTIYSGASYSGTGIYKKVLKKGIIVKSYDRTDQNWNDSGEIPMQYLDYGTSGVYYALEWSNGTLTTKALDDNGTATLAVCLAQSGFETKIEPDTPFYLPSVYLGVYDGDVDEGSNVFKRWFYHYKMPDCMREDENEPLTQQDMQIGYNVSQYGIQSIKWDYGWWSDTACGSWKTNEGLLEVHNSAYLGVIKGAGCKNLAEFVAKANKAGVKLATYILLKDTQLDREGVPTSVGTYGHPEWFSDVCITGVGNSADLGNVECVKFFQEYMLNFFKENGVTTWRSDFEPIVRSSPRANRHSANGNDVQYWATVGFSELVDYLNDNLDDFRYESCCSGGAMKDFFTMTKAAVINCDDSADYMSLHMSFYDSSYCIHPMQLQLPCNALTYTKGSANYTGTADYIYGLRCVMTGGVMLSNWGGTTAEDKSYWPYQIKDLYNTRLKPLIREGDLYHILARPDCKHWDGLEYVDADSARNIKGCVMLWKPTNTEGNQKTITLRGLKADVNYQLTFEDRTEQNCVMSGADLMAGKLTVTISESVGSEIIWLTEAK